jgi:hypothetical protein
MNNNTRKSTMRGMENWLRNLACRRPNSIVTADDANQYLDRKGVPRRVRMRLSFINSVLRNPNFKQVGVRPSRRPVAKCRTISMWRVAV